MPPARKEQQIFSRRDVKNEAGMPVGSRRALIYNIPISPRCYSAVLTWNLEQMADSPLALSEEIGLNPQDRKTIIIKKLKTLILEEPPPSSCIFTLQSVNEDLLTDLLKSLNDNQDGPWKASTKEGLATCYQSEQMKLLHESYKKTSKHDKSLISTFELLLDRTTFNLVNMHRALRKDHGEAVKDFSDDLSNFSYELPDASKTFIIGDVNHEIVQIHKFGAVYYIPTSAQKPEFCLKKTAEEKGDGGGRYSLVVQVPKTIDTCLVQDQGASSYQLLIPDYFIGQTEDLISVQASDTNTLKRQSRLALLETLLVYSVHLKSWIAQRKKTLATEFLSELDTASGNKDTLNNLIRSGKIISSDNYLKVQAPNLSLPDADVQYLPRNHYEPNASPQEINYFLNKPGLTNVHFLANPLGRTILKISSSVELQNDCLGNSDKTVKEGSYCYKLTDFKVFQRPYLNSSQSMRFAKCRLDSYLLNYRKVHGGDSSQWTILDRAIGEYTDTVCRFLEDTDTDRAQFIPILENQLLEKETNLLTGFISLARGNPSMGKKIYNGLSLFLKSVNQCLKPFLKNIVIGAVLGGLAGWCFGVVPLGVVSGALLGGGLAFFKNYPKAVRRVLSEELSDGLHLSHFFARPKLLLKKEVDSNKLSNWS